MLKKSPGVRYGNRQPRVFTPPLRPLEPRTPETEANTLGYAVIDFATEILEMPPLPWQEWFYIHGLELRPDGAFRYKTLLLLVARQNGKSTISLVLGLFALYILQWSTVLGVAQDLDTSEEILDLATELCNATEEDDDGEEHPLRPWLAAQIAKIVAINGKRSLVLKGRRRWKVKAASRGAGRGFSGDLILFDELREQKDWLAWGAVTKSTMARSHALIMALSNAGDIRSAVLKHLRRVAHLAVGDPDGIGELTAIEKFMLASEQPDSAAEADETLFIAEWSAAPGRDKNDRDGWAEANPSLGWLIEERTIAGAARTDPEWVFRTEVLCQWPDGAIEAPYPPGTWDACANDVSTGLCEADRLTGPLVACIGVSSDQSRGHVVVAGWRADGRPQVEHRASRVGTHWFESFLSDPKVAARVTHVTGQTKGGAEATVLQQLKESETFRIPVVDWSGQPLLDAHVEAFQAITEGVLAHNSQPALDAAASTASTRNLGGVAVIDVRNSPVDASPLLAAIGALWLLRHKPEEIPYDPPSLPEVAVAETPTVTREPDLASVAF